MKRIPIILSCMLAVGACHHAELLQQAGMADFEGKLEEFGATRTILNGNTVRWCEGDRISIFEGNSYSNRYEAEGIAANSTTCRFVLKETTQQQGDRFQNNIALYPYSSDATVREMENAFLIGGVTLQDIQFHDYETFGSGAFPMVAVTGSLEDKVLDFKNVCGVLKLNLTGSETIGSITLTGNADEALAGPAEILAYHDRSPEIFIGENAAKSITLDCGAGVTLNTRESTSFHFVLPPMEFSQGFTLTITEADGKSHEVKTERVQTIARSNILSMPSVTVDGIPSDEAVPQESIVIELAEGATRDNLSFTISTDDESYGYYCTLMSTGAEQWLNKTSFEGLAESLSKDMSGTGFYNFQGTASTHFTHRHSGDKPDYQSAFIVMTLDQNGNASEAGYLIVSFDPGADRLKDWGVVGYFSGWGNKEKDVKMTLEGEWLVARNVYIGKKYDDYSDGGSKPTDFKFRQGNDWNNDDYGSKNRETVYPDREYPLGRENVTVHQAGYYDIYLSKYFNRYKITETK